MELCNELRYVTFTQALVSINKPRISIVLSGESIS
jgi:hypothetical protein